MTIHKNVLGLFFDQTWAMRPESMARYLEVVRGWSIGMTMDKAAVESMMAAKEERNAGRMKSVNGDIAVLNVFGVIGQRMNMIQEVSDGGTSTEKLGQQFDAAINNDEIGAVVLNIDSPGGSVYGVPELADKIHKARGTKPIVAVANSMAASAAYWIGAAAEQFTVTPSGEAGSIGVFALHQDWSKFNEAVGVQPTYISAGKYKVEGHPDSPLDPEAKQAIQQSVDGYYGMFVDAVASYRGTTSRRVRAGFGEGRMLMAGPAVEEGMVDRVATLETVIRELQGKPRRRKSGQSASQFADVRRRKLESQRKLTLTTPDK